MELCKRKSRREYFALLDIGKVYDKVNKNILCEVLRKCGMTEKIVRIIISSMTVTTRVKYNLGNIKTEWVYNRRGLRQGCILLSSFSACTQKSQF